MTIPPYSYWYCLLLIYVHIFVGGSTFNNDKNLLLSILSAPIVLIGGPTSNSGHVYARNPRTGIFGPVCDDFFRDADVR